MARVRKRQAAKRDLIAQWVWYAENADLETADRFLAERQRSDFSRIYGYGVASVLFFHLAVNVGMTIGLMPVIGIPLPFFSYGGSSLWSFTILLFIFIKLDANRLVILR